MIQVRTDYALQQLKISNLHVRQISFNHQAYIVDIDVDFWEDKEITPEDIQIIRNLMLHTKLVTIATSPYFMDQKRAIEIVKKLLT